MKTGIVDGAFRINGVIDYELMKETGYDCVDSNFFTNTKRGIFTADAEAFKAQTLEEKHKIIDAGLEIYQCHAPWPVVDTSPEKRKISFEYMQTAIRGYSIMEAKNFVVHPIMPYKWEIEIDSDYVWDINFDYFSRLCDYAKEYGLNVCIENMPTMRHKLADIPHIIELVDSINKDNCFICLDTGHVNIVKQDCGDMVRLCGDRLKCLHIHDNKGMQDTHLLPYDGSVDWESFKTAIHETSFCGVVSLETGAMVSKCPPSVAKAYTKAIFEVVKYLAE